MSEEKLRLDYRQNPQYEEDDLNVVGATTSTTLRTGLAVPGVNDAYVKKYGTQYPVLDVMDAVVNIPRGGGGGGAAVTLRYRIFAADGTLLGTITDNGASAYVDGAAVAANTDIYIILDTQAPGVPSGPVAGDTITLTTNIDAGLTVVLSQESISFGGQAITWYVSSSGSTYYDSAYKYGGYRHVPVLGSAKYPYFGLQAALGAIGGGGGTIIEVLDSESYETSFFGLTLNIAGMTLQSSLGQTPMLVQGRGARISRYSTQYHNGTAIYYNENGNNANTGLWQSPKATASGAWAAKGVAQDVVYGGTGATTYGSIVDSVTMNAADVLFADHEYVPTIENSTPSTRTIHQTVAGAIVDGFIIRGSAGSVQGVASATVNIAAQDCTFTGCYQAFAAVNNITSERCHIYGCSIAFYEGGNAPTFTIRNNLIHDCWQGLWRYAGAGQSLGNIEDNVFYRISEYAIYFQTGDFNGGLANNTVHDCKRGVHAANGLTGNVEEHIFHECSEFGVWAGGAITENYCCYYLCGAATGGVGPHTNNFPIVSDPLFSDADAGWLGLQPGSSCLRADAAGTGDIGAEWNIINQTANGVTVDNFYVYGMHHMNKAFWYSGGFPHPTGLTLKWLTVYGFNGTTLEFPSNAISTIAIDNSIITDNGVGIYFGDDSNSVSECLIYKNRRHGVYCGTGSQTISHCTFHQNEHSIYLGATATNITIIDTIISNSSLYEIYSPIFVAPTYCCIDGTVSSSVDTSDPSNIFANPLFIDTTTIGSEDYHLRTTEGGYSFESPAKDAASDSYDMGCYLIDREVTDWTWETYELAHHSWTLDERSVAKGAATFPNSDGDQKMSAISHRRQFTLRWNPTSAMDVESGPNRDRKFLEYISSLVQTDENGLASNQGLVRLHFRPREYIYPGTEIDVCDDDIVHGTAATGTVDADDATIYMATGNFVPNEFKGYHASIRWYESAVGVVNAAAETIAVAGAPWVVNEWAGYWVRQGMYYFYILSNTVNTLTVSDPYDRLVDVAANFEFYIESYHKVLRNDDIYLYLHDPDSQLIDGSYEWFVDFIVCRLRSSDADIQRQLGSRIDLPFDATVGRLEFEEAGICE